MDNGSTLSIFCNHNLVKDTTPSNQTFNLQTNAGVRQCDLEARVPEFGTVWIDQKLIGNIFTLKQLKQLAPVTYES